MNLINEHINGLKDGLIEEIIELAKEHKINKVYLYGSRAKGDYKERRYLIIWEWLYALVARNNVSHAYNQAIAKEIINKSKTRYAVMLKKLEDTIKEEWFI